MKSIILFLCAVVVVSCANSSEEQQPKGIDSDENSSERNGNNDNTEGKSICNCFFGNEEAYNFSFPDECDSKDSLLVLIPDTISFHEDGFRSKMFNLYKDIQSFLVEQKFSGKILAYYDKDQQHLALELNMLNGRMNGKMKAYSFESETKIERLFKNGSLTTVESDMGNVDWTYNKDRNEIEMDESYFGDREISLMFSPDMKHQSIIDWETKPEEIFDRSKPLKVNDKPFSGSVLYYGDNEGFTPLPIAKLNFSNGLLDGKTTFYGDYENYPQDFDAWVVMREVVYSKGVRLAAPDPLDEFVLYQGDTFMEIDGEKVLNEFKLAFELINDSVQEAGSLELSQGFPRQYYITGGSRSGNTLEIEMVSVSDARMSTIENAISNGERHKMVFLIADYSLSYSGTREGCDYCAPGLLLKKYDPSETEFIGFVRIN